MSSLYRLSIFYAEDHAKTSEEYTHILKAERVICNHSRTSQHQTREKLHREIQEFAIKSQEGQQKAKRANKAINSEGTKDDIYKQRLRYAVPGTPQTTPLAPLGQARHSKPQKTNRPRDSNPKDKLALVLG